MAGGEGEGKEQKWGVFDAVVCARTGGRRGGTKSTAVSASLLVTRSTSEVWPEPLIYVKPKSLKENACSLGTDCL